MYVSRCMPSTHRLGLPRSCISQVFISFIPPNCVENRPDLGLNINSIYVLYTNHELKVLNKYQLILLATISCHTGVSAGDILLCVQSHSQQKLLKMLQVVVKFYLYNLLFSIDFKVLILLAYKTSYKVCLSIQVYVRKKIILDINSEQR